MSFPCPYSGVDICFIGKKENVDKSIEASNQELNALLNGADFTALTDPRPKNDLFNDPQILDIVMYVINELQAEGEICCRCPEGEHGEYMIDILEDHVHLACKKCGASTDIPADSIVSANAFLHCTHIDLV